MPVAGQRHRQGRHDQRGLLAATGVPADDPTMEHVTHRRLAASRPAASDVPVEFAGLDGQSLELDDKSVDAALSAWTLHDSRRRNTW
jgi:hypothetical protein